MSIFSDEQEAILKDLYTQYNEVIKPLIIHIESLFEKFPTPIHNELRAFNDHIARCYLSNPDIDIDNELDKAKGHIKRTIFDCFKFLNVSYYEKVKAFEKRTKNLNLYTINNGRFSVEYADLESKCVHCVRAAKKSENKGLFDDAFENYELAFNHYQQLYELIEDNQSKLVGLKVKRFSRFMLKFVWYIVTMIVTVIFTLAVSYFEPNLQNSKVLKPYLKPLKEMIEKDTLTDLDK